jgi:hypothetical protein
MLIAIAFGVAAYLISRDDDKYGANAERIEANSPLRCYVRARLQSGRDPAFPSRKA